MSSGEPKRQKNTQKRAQQPRHVAIIMDGNGRWAKRQGKMRIMGHRAGVKAVRRAVQYAVDHQIEAMTLYAFSSENWRRPESEVFALMDLFIFVLKNEIKNIHSNNVKLNIIGDISRFSQRLQQCVRAAEALTQHNTGLRLNIAANYGGRWDIMQAVQKVATQVQAGELDASALNEQVLESQLTLHDQPPVDVVIRTGGEYRISNFLLWQIAYAELFFIDVLWPDFDHPHFDAVLTEFARRERRFGGTHSS